jgi:hypothetical protein
VIADRLLVERVARIAYRASWDPDERYSDVWAAMPDHAKESWRGVARKVLGLVGYSVHA